jgi:hypothetical protein
MEWECSYCTYLNPSDVEICAMFEQGLRSFPTNSSEDNLLEDDTEDQSSEQINNQSKTWV